MEQLHTSRLRAGLNGKTGGLIGDGESNEGTVWEAALLASHHKLDNLVCIIDHNHTTDRAVSVGDMVAKFRAFDWKAVSVNGHNQKELYKAVLLPHPGKPLAIVAETIKGYGSKTMEEDPSWHHRSPTKDEFKQMVKELRS